MIFHKSGSVCHIFAGQDNFILANKAVVFHLDERSSKRSTLTIPFF